MLCQTSLPYRNPGKDVIRWEWEQGAVSLLVNAGEAKNPDTGQWIQLGLPFGSKPRLILAHLNAQAIKTGSPVLHLDDSFTAFVKRVQGRDPTGPEVRDFKTHLGCISAANISMSISAEGRIPVQVDTKIVTAFDLWFTKNVKQRVLWPSTIQMSLDYFNSLQNHAVPLDDRALAALAHSSLCLDIYSWLAQRLHRIPKGKPQFTTWAATKDQFGQGYAAMNNFKRVFRVAMKQVLIQYQAARVEEDGRGLTLYNSAPPVPKRLYVVNKPVSL